MLNFRSRTWILVVPEVQLTPTSSDGTPGFRTSIDDNFYSDPVLVNVQVSQHLASDEQTKSTRIQFVVEP